MSKTYLFSPVGNTDPIKYFHDGSLLHICRYYKPDVVYLYLSKEILKTHQKDNRYVKTLELLGEKLDHTFDIRLIEDEDMINVQQYDVFYEKFRNILKEIESQKEKADCLLVNMASGTPAMKSALVVMATLAEYRFLPVQVSSPKKESNLEYEDRIEYDVDANFELDMDNEETAENRCQEVKCMNLLLLLKKDMIKKHIATYDYKAALQVGKEIKDDLDQESYRWLEVAEARAAMDWKRVNRVLPDNQSVLTKIKEDNWQRILFEYTLILGLKVKRGEYADFIRAITPLGVDLLELVIEQYCDINITEYYERGEPRKWSRNRLEGTEMLDIVKGDFLQFKYGPVYSSQLNNIVQARCQDELMARRVRELVDVEKKVRNIAAHSIVSVTPEWIKERTEKSVEEIMWLIRYLCEKVKINTRKENWDAYDTMNAYIIGQLDR